MKNDLAPLTASRMKSFRACPRQHYYRYVQGYTPVATAHALAFGTAVHAALEAWWMAAADPLRAALDAIEAQALAPFDRARARAMLVLYDLTWSARGFTALAVEAKFSSPLRNPETSAASRTWQLEGKIDVIARARDGKVWVIEHKTTSEDAGAGSSYRQRLQLDGQVSQYIDGAASLGHAVEGCLYDVLVKPAIKPLVATPVEARRYTKAGKLYATQREHDETPDEYEARCLETLAADPERFATVVPVYRLESDRDEYAYDVWQLGLAMHASARTGHAPRNPDACHRYGTPCAFWSVCTGAASLDDASKFQRLGDVNPELREAAA